MPNLEEQTAVQRVGDGKYRAEVSTDWKMWVPVGGYLASIAMRAAQAETEHPRPASLTCHYLAEANFGEAELEVTKLRTNPQSDSLRVSMRQQGVTILEAMIWAVPTGGYGPKVDFLQPPDVPPPDGLAEIVLDEDVVEMMGDEPFWKNFEIRPIRLGHTLPVEEGLTEEEKKLRPKRAARIRAWDRFMGGQTYSDPWVDACRYLIISDVSQFPTVATPFTPPLQFIAPTLDLTVEFHNFAPQEEWLLIEGTGSAAADGLIGAESRLWTRTGEVLATGQSHMLFVDLSAPSSPATEGTWFETTANA
jgi:acyl-CoA thioesterase